MACSTESPLLPTLEEDDTANLLLSHSVFSGQAGLADFSRGVLGSDLFNLSSGEDVHAMSIAPVVCSSPSTFVVLVSVVVGNRAQKPVGGVVATRCVAMVKDVHAIWDGTDLDGVADPRGYDHADVPAGQVCPVPKLSVGTSRSCGPLPEPALIRMSWSNLFPVPLFQRFPHLVESSKLSAEESEKAKVDRDTDDEEFLW